MEMATNDFQDLCEMSFFASTSATIESYIQRNYCKYLTTVQMYG